MQIDFDADYLILLWAYYGLPIEREIVCLSGPTDCTQEPVLYKLKKGTYRQEDGLIEEVDRKLAKSKLKELKKQLLEVIRYGLPEGAIIIKGQDLKKLIMQRFGALSTKATSLLDDLLYNEIASYSEQSGTLLKAENAHYASVARGGFNKPYNHTPYHTKDWRTVILSLVPADKFQSIHVNDEWGIFLREGRKGRLERIEELIKDINAIYDPMQAIKNAENKTEQAAERKNSIEQKSVSDDTDIPRGLVFLRGDGVLITPDNWAGSPTKEPYSDSQAGSTPPAQSVGGVAANTGPEGTGESRKQLTPEQQKKEYIKRLKKLRFEKIEIQDGTTEKMRFFDDTHIDIIEKQFLKFLEVAETRKGNGIFVPQTVKNKGRGANLTFEYSGKKYSIGLCSINMKVRIWLRREPKDPSEDSKMRSFIYQNDDPPCTNR